MGKTFFFGKQRKDKSICTPKAPVLNKSLWLETLWKQNCIVRLENWLQDKKKYFLAAEVGKPKK